MRILMGILLATVLLFIFSISYKKSKDIFHPLAFFSLLQFIRYVPMMIYGYSDTNVVITEEGVAVLFVMEIIVVISVVIGFYSYKKLPLKHPNLLFPKKNPSFKLVGLGYILFFIGFFSRLYFVHQLGGLIFLLENIQMKQSLVSGQGYLLALGYFMTFGICIIIDYYHQYRLFSIKRKLLVYIMILANFILLGIMSDRAPVLISAMMIVMIYHYKIQRISIKMLLRPRYLLLFVLAVLFVVAMPLLRNSQGYMKYGNLLSLLNAAFENLETIPRWFSFVGRDIFVYENFRFENFWFGKNIINLIYSPLPRSLFPLKPPVDEGIYLANIINGFNVSPPSNIYTLNNSYPFSNQGIFYANFGFVGLLLGSMLLGYLYAFVYKGLKKSQFYFASIIIYQVIIYKWSFTSHAIVGSLSLFVYLLVPLVFFAFFKSKLIK
jgi:oligosaccharide repeat unit polymerase